MTRSVAWQAWCYPKPNKRYAAIKDYLAFYANKGLDITLNGKEVSPMESSFYGGWIYEHLFQ